MSIRRIALLTDFGAKDIYVGVVKAVISSIAPEVQLLDLCHGIPPQNIAVAAKMLRAAACYFLADTLHLAIVDPGVGTSRAIIYAQSSLGHFLAPDNGLLFPVLKDCLECKIFRLDSPKHELRNASKTFHGRDKFAPYAAYLARGVKAEELGTVLPQGLASIVELESQRPVWTQDSVAGQVDFVDIYGNLSTNIERASFSESWLVAEKLELKIEDQTHVVTLVKSYAAAGKGELLAIFNSFGCLEISCNHGSAAEVLHLALGSLVRLSVVSELA